MKIIIVANKWWEVAPLIALLQHKNPRQRDLSAVPCELLDAFHPGPGGPSLPVPRLVVRCNDVNVEVWCVQDLMDPVENSSLTWEKARVLPFVIRDDGEKSLVIAFGTAACPAGSDRNGNVVIGSSVFVHDPYKTPPDPQKHWTHDRLNQVVTSDVQGLFDKLSRQFMKEADKRLLSPPNAASAPLRIHMDSSLVSVGVVNVTSSADYAWTDKQALAKFKDITGSTSTESLETTHGVIRFVLGPRFLYVSGIANGIGQFVQQISPNPYSQNFVAVHNAAIAVAWIIPELAVALQS